MRHGDRIAVPWRDRYVVLVCLMLGGYAVIGRGFASIGAPPLFIGEMALAVGLWAVIQNGNFVLLFATGPSLMLMALLGWIVIRVIPGVQLFGMIALRDAVIVGYALYAIIVVSLLMERPERLSTIIRLYRAFAGFYGLFAPLLFYAAVAASAYMPTWPGSTVTLISVRPGEIAVHLMGTSVFTLAGFRRATPLWIISILLGVVFISPSRGATLAFVIPLSVAILLTGKTARFAPYFVAGACVFMLAYTLDLNVPMTEGRSLGPRQIVENAISLVGTSGAGNMDNTKAWRLAWWKAIEDYTFNGQYYWTGKGFGESLAEIDGFVVGEELGGPLLRSPHSAHLTLLARAGVPGLFLWLSGFVSWFAMMGHSMLIARRRNEPGWNGLFVWISCTVAAILIDASFDVALEGPMIGIWFWCMFGLGIGATMIYRAAIPASDTHRARRMVAALRRPSLSELVDADVR